MNRRTFLRQAGTGVLGLALVGSLVAPAAEAAEAAQLGTTQDPPVPLAEDLKLVSTPQRWNESYISMTWWYNGQRYGNWLKVPNKYLSEMGSFVFPRTALRYSEYQRFQKIAGADADWARDVSNVRFYMWDARTNTGSTLNFERP